MNPVNWKIIAIIAVAVLLAVAVGSRLLLRTRTEFGAHSAWVDSPNDRFRARLVRVEESAPLADSQSFYALELEMKLADGGTAPVSKQKVEQLHIPDPSILGDPDRIEEVITWSDDCHHVICVGRDSEVSVPVPF